MTKQSDAYNRREVPHVYDRGWLATELGNLQRAIQRYSTRTVTKDYTASALDQTILCDASAGAFTLTLPKAEGNQGLMLTIKKIAGPGKVFIGGTVDGATALALNSVYDAITIQSDGTTWYELAASP